MKSSELKFRDIFADEDGDIYIMTDEVSQSRKVGMCLKDSITCLMGRTIYFEGHEPVELVKKSDMEFKELRLD